MAYKKLKYWFDKDLAKMLSKKIIAVEPSFPQKAFIKNIDQRVDSLELKDRVEVIADELYKALGGDFKKGTAVLMKTLGPENENETGMFTEYYWLMPFAKYVEKYGLNDFKISMKAIAEITKRNTGEYSIRPFLKKDQDQTIRQMMKWSVASNKHLRRLSCEGVRPRLPWATKLDTFIADPKPILPILNNLKDDPSKYVQKSVANCLNDILKDNFEIGKALLEEWNQEGIGKERKWIVKHALRNFLKAGDEWAMGMVS